MKIIQDILFLLGCALASMFFLYRSHINFQKDYDKMGYVHLIVSLLIILIFFGQAAFYIFIK